MKIKTKAGQTTIKAMASPIVNGHLTDLCRGDKSPVFPPPLLGPPYPFPLS